MDSTVLVIAFAVGIIAGLRAMTAPMVTSWAAHLGWINLNDTWLSWFGSAIAAYIFLIAAIGEIINDKMPKTPSRKAPPSFIVRIVMGGLSGLAIATGGHQSAIVGAILGAIGAVVGTLGGYSARTGLVKALKCPDLVIALCEDALAVGGGFFLVSRL